MVMIMRMLVVILTSTIQEQKQTFYICFVHNVKHNFNGYDDAFEDSFLSMMMSETP